MLSPSIARNEAVRWRDLQTTLLDLTAAASRSSGLNLRFCVITLSTWASGSEIVQLATSSRELFLLLRSQPIRAPGLDLPVALPAICSETVGGAASWLCPIQWLSGCYLLNSFVHNNLMTQMFYKLVLGDGKVLALKSSCDELLDYSVATLDASNLLMKLRSGDWFRKEESFPGTAKQYSLSPSIHNTGLRGSQEKVHGLLKFSADAKGVWPGFSFDVHEMVSLGIPLLLWRQALDYYWPCVVNNFHLADVSTTLSLQYKTLSIKYYNIYQDASQSSLILSSRATFLSFTSS